MIEDYFAIQVFFIILRETLETAIIVSVLLSFINQQFPSENPHETETYLKNQQTKRKLTFQVWFGAIAGLTICLIIGLIFIAAFYYIGKDYWSYTERLWEGLFSILSSLIITIMGLGLLRINKVMKVKWWIKLGDAYTQQDSTKLLEEEEETEDMQDMHRLAHKNKHSHKEKYFLMILPLVTTLREGLEAVVFIGGSAVTNPPSSIPLSIILGVAFGSAIGYGLYKGGNKLSLQYFLTLSTCFLYLVSAGLMSRGVWFLELEQFVRRCDGMDVSETGSGPGSYDIAKSVWHVNCCNGLTDGWWMVLNAIVGWTNSATYGSVLTYIGYWVVVIGWLKIKLIDEKHGYLPFLPVRWQLKRIRWKLKLLGHKPRESDALLTE